MKAIGVKASTWAMAKPVKMRRKLSYQDIQ